MLIKLILMKNDHKTGPLEDLYGGRVCRGFPSEPRARGFHFREVERRQREVIVRFDYLMADDGSFDLTTL